MKIVGCDLHARQQSIAMVDTETGELTEKRLMHEGNAVRDFYASLEGPVVVGIEATGAMQFLERRVASERRASVSGQECTPAKPTRCRADRGAGTQDRTAGDGTRFFKKSVAT